MKKLAALFIVIILAITLIATPVFAAPGNEKGAVKGDWNLVTSTGEVVGSVIINSTGSGKLNVLVNVDNRPDLVNWDVRVVIKNGGHFDFVDVLNTNAQGHGNAHVSLNIPSNILNNYEVMNNLEVIAKESLALDTTPRFITIENVPLK